MYVSFIMSSGSSSPINVASPISVNIASPVIATSPINITSPVINGTSPDISLPANATPPPALVASHPVKAESPESHCSAYSTVYSPVASSPNVDADCCGNSSIKVRRQRLRPWLIAQINSGEIPGLVWLDKENMIFKIPWKHFGRPGVDMYLDALLFRRWALHTKKFEQGRPSDISTWKTRFRCALHKLPDIEELNDQNQTEGEEPYRVYKFRKIELEKIPRGGPPDDEPESSIGSVGSPVSASYPMESTTFATCVDSYRSSTSSINNYRSPVTSTCVYPKQELSDSHINYPRKRHPHRPKVGGMPATDIHKWQCYDQMRIQETYPSDKSSIAMSDECVYDDDEKILRKMPLSKQSAKEDNKYQMDYETDDDDVSWNSRNCIQINQPIQSVPSIVPRYPQYYSQSSPKERGFEPFERHYSRATESNEIGVIKNLKSTQKRLNLDKDTYEEDDNELFFQSCAKRIKKLDSKSSGYLKLKILEQFYYVENFQQQNQYNQNHQSYRYCADPPPLISSANVRMSEQVIDVDDSMHNVK